MAFITQGRDRFRARPTFIDSGELRSEKRAQFVPRDQVHTVVEINVTGFWHDMKLLWIIGEAKACSLKKREQACSPATSSTGRGEIQES
jgi:hypothetical protein